MKIEATFLCQSITTEYRFPPGQRTEHRLVAVNHPTAIGEAPEHQIQGDISIFGDMIEALAAHPFATIKATFEIEE